MIWFDNNQAKKNLIIILVVVFMIFIFWLWLKFSPWQTPATSSVQNMTNQTQVTSTSPWDELKNTWQQAGDQIAKWQTAWQRQEKQQELLDAAKKYVAGLASSTATSTATSTPAN